MVSLVGDGGCHDSLQSYKGKVMGARFVEFAIFQWGMEG